MVAAARFRTASIHRPGRGYHQGVFAFRTLDDTRSALEMAVNRQQAARTQLGVAQARMAQARALRQLRQQLDEQKDKYLRLAAEFDNYRKRSAKERLEAGPRAQGDLVRQLLDIRRCEAGGARLEPRRFDLVEFLGDLAAQGFSGAALDLWRTRPDMCPEPYLFSPQADRS